MMKIQTFDGETLYLSNFFERKGLFVWNGVIWDHSEGPYQVSKCLDSLNDRSFLEQFVKLSPRETKNWGKPGAMVRRGQYLRHDWEDVKVQVMREIVLAKFEQNPDLKQLLIDTGDAELIEGNWWGDRFWGVSPIGSKNGRNELGKILMEIRTLFTGREMNGIICYH